MPILLMALLALLVFGVIGILLTTAMIMEHSKRKHTAMEAAAHAVPAGATPPLNPKLR